jgi:DNA-nicking Smr family endonuclease
MGSRRESRRDHRPVSAEEAQLWEAVTRNMMPAKSKPRVAGPPEADAEAAVGQRGAGAAAAARPPAKQRPHVAPDAPRAGFDRRQARGIASGRIAIGARLDLHGCRERDARVRLAAFLLSAQQQGHTTVLVITGKGSPRPAAYAREGGLHDLGDSGTSRASGVLRRSVPLWLAEPDLRELVIGYAEAGGRHGGEGALYVRLRRRERGPR